MTFLADTHAALWWLRGNASLSRAARAALADENHVVFVSAASIWEIATKHRLGKLPEADIFGEDISSRLLTEGFQLAPVTPRQAEIAGGFDDPHRDPFDRLLIAQALLEDLTLISNEVIFDRFGVSRLW